MLFEDEKTISVLLLFCQADQSVQAVFENQCFTERSYFKNQDAFRIIQLYTNYHSPFFSFLQNLIFPRRVQYRCSVYCWVGMWKTSTASQILLDIGKKCKKINYIKNKFCRQLQEKMLILNGNLLIYFENFFSHYLFLVRHVHHNQALYSYTGYS